MFLSKTAVIKQLLHEFLKYDLLELHPGHPANAEPGSLLGSSSNNDLAVFFELVETQLKLSIGGQECTPEEKEQFNNLFLELIEYKKGSHSRTNRFALYVAAKSEIQAANPCAWSVFAPLLIDNITIKCRTKETLLANLDRVGVQFQRDCPIENTGLWIATNTKNHEMVNAFLCPEFANYYLNQADFIKLLHLTEDFNTRMVLFRNADAKNLLTWIDSDPNLKENCLRNFAELAELWSYFTECQRQQFIKNTSSQLWLQLLENDLGSSRIANLLTDTFLTQLRQKLLSDETIQDADSMPQIIHYLDSQKHFYYLMSNNLCNSLYPFPRNKNQNWNHLLAALGYPFNNSNKLITTRYALPDVVMKVHNNLVQTLLSLPLDAEEIINALKTIEEYVRHPDTKERYQEFMQNIANNALNKEYEQGFFIWNWINKLLRFLKIKSKTPLHPYIEQLVTVSQQDQMKENSTNIMKILDPKTAYKSYPVLMSAYFEGNISKFWHSFSYAEKKSIIGDPFKFEVLLKFLSTDQNIENFIKSLDDSFLLFFNTKKGIYQLLLQSPSFKVAIHLPTLINAMQVKKIQFLANAEDAAELLVDQEIKEFDLFFPFKSEAGTIINVQEQFAFQQKVLAALPRPLRQTHLERFLTVYGVNGEHFANLMSTIAITNPMSVTEYWQSFANLIQTQWLPNLQHGKMWFEKLTHLELSDRLKFFYLLANKTKISPNEFCLFLAQKEALDAALWDKISTEQWNTWIKDYSLPKGTPALLKQIKYPYRITFFQYLLADPEQNHDARSLLQDLPDETVKFFYTNLHRALARTEYLNDSIITTVTKQMADLKKIVQKYPSSVNKLNMGVLWLKDKLNEMNTLLQSENGSKQFFGFFGRGATYYKILQTIKQIGTDIDNSLEKIVFAPTIKTPDVIQTFVELKTHLSFCESQIANLPQDVQKQFTEISKLLERIQKLIPEQVTLSENETNTQLIGAASP